MPKVCLFALAIATSLIFATLFVLTPKAFAADVKINEFVAAPSSGNQEWVEFYNPEGIDLTTYFLDDDTDFSSDSGSSGKKSLSAINTSNSTYHYLEFGSFLNNSGDYVVLFDANGSIIDQYQYTEDPGDDVSIGRSPDGTGSFDTLTSQTKGSANSQPQPDPSPTPTTSSLSQPNSTKSPSPTPKTTTGSSFSSKSPTPTPVKSSAKSSPQVLSESFAEATQQSINLFKDSPEPSPSPQAETSNSKTKVAAIFAGSGTILIGLSFAFYWWYRRTLNQKGSEIEDKS